jgi:hypothetical protein
VRPGLFQDKGVRIMNISNVKFGSFTMTIFIFSFIFLNSTAYGQSNEVVYSGTIQDIIINYGGASGQPIGIKQYTFKLKEYQKYDFIMLSESAVKFGLIKSGQGSVLTTNMLRGAPKEPSPLSALIGKKVELTCINKGTSSKPNYYVISFKEIK